MPPRPRKPSIILESRKVSELLADPRNARVHSQRNIDEIRYSLRRYGQQKNVVVTSDGVMIAGSGTLEAARQEEWEFVDVKVWTGSLADARGYGLIDNRSAEHAEWNDEILAEDLGQFLPDERAELGWKDSEWDALLTRVNDEIDEDASPGLGDMEFRIIIECDSEMQQKTLLEKLEAEGLNVRAVMS